MTHDVWPLIGDLGRLVAIPFTATESVSSGDRYVERVSIAGHRRVQAIPSVPRAWDVSIPHGFGPDMAALQGFTSGAWGHGPWHWVSVQAQHENMLTPREAMLLDYYPTGFLSTGGPIIVNGVRSPLSLLHNRSSSWSPVFRNIPVLPGRAVTWSAEINSAGGVAPRLVIQLVNAAGGTISNTYGVGAVSSAVQRVSATVVPPSNAVAMHACLDYTTTRMIRPQVTWTDGPVAYGPGHGCRSAVIDGASSELTVLSRSGTVSSAGFTVLEVS